MTRVDRDRRAERLLRGRLAAGRRRCPGGRGHRCAAAVVGGAGTRRAGVLPRGGDQDHHVALGITGRPNRTSLDSWPVHCEVGTAGEAFHPDLDPQSFDAIFLKGQHAAAYSGFEGARSTRPLADWLRAREVTGWTCAASRPTAASGPRRWTRSRPASRPGCWPGCAQGGAGHHPGRVRGHARGGSDRCLTCSRRRPTGPDLTFNRPASFNAMTDGCRTGSPRRWSRVPVATRSAWSITGAGDAFNAGADISGADAHEALRRPRARPRQPDGAGGRLPAWCRSSPRSADRSGRGLLDRTGRRPDGRVVVRVVPAGLRPWG